MKKISTFDLVMIVIFVVVGLLGGGAWWYLSGLLDTAKKGVSDAAQSFKQYTSNEVFLPSESNIKTLETNTNLMKGLIDPVIQSKLQSVNNKVFAVTKQDPVAWKKDLDDRVSRLNNLAKIHGVTTPAKFYYSFSRYLNTNPGEDKTVVLTKQLLGIEQIVDILIDAPVSAIQAVRRTYDEDEGGNTNAGSTRTGDKDVLPGRVINVDGGVYADYPFEMEIDTTTDGLRKIINDLNQSPYIFVVRNVTLQNSKTKSPLISDLDKIAAEQPDSPDSTSGTAASDSNAKPARPPQYLFGGEYLHIKLRIDMIEWKGLAAAEATAPPAGGKSGNRGRNSAPGSNR